MTAWISFLFSIDRWSFIWLKRKKGNHLAVIIPPRIDTWSCRHPGLSFFREDIRSCRREETVEGEQEIISGEPFLPAAIKRKWKQSVMCWGTLMTRRLLFSFDLTRRTRKGKTIDSLDQETRDWLVLLEEAPQRTNQSSLDKESHDRFHFIFNRKWKKETDGCDLMSIRTIVTIRH